MQNTTLLFPDPFTASQCGNWRQIAANRGRQVAANGGKLIAAFCRLLSLLIRAGSFNSIPLGDGVFPKNSFPVGSLQRHLTLALNVRDCRSQTQYVIFLGPFHDSPIQSKFTQRYPRINSEFTSMRNDRFRILVFKATNIVLLQSDQVRR